MRFEVQDKNSKLIKRLNGIVESDRVSHAYIFEAPVYTDKRSFAESFVKGILCPKKLGENCGACGICDKIDHGNHEDLIRIYPEDGSIKDADIIKMQDMIRTKPLGSRHVVIIENSDTMTLRAQNRLLKTLEEPPGRTVIILLSENMENLVPTILSRCVKYRINDDRESNASPMLAKAEQIALMALKREPFYRIRKEIERVAGSRDDAYGFLDAIQMILRDMMIQGGKEISVYKGDKFIDSIHAVENARKQIKEGVSPSYAIKNLIIVIGG